ncbi:MAG: U32 family peptidase [Bacteroidaceae bacterium]|nr:U32 family peptidase [Bacteroidaceae bacterium]
MRKLELLAPARTADIGIEAIRHGADAVYIGAPRFGARMAAGNTVEDIGRLVRFAHLFGARVYVTINTLLHDDELDEVERLTDQLHDIGVDALIVQDPKILTLRQYANPGDGGYIPLHASTQMDNRTSGKVRLLHESGYQQIVLARELSLEDIARIHEEVPEARLEVFVHGALCVSLSGRCYASEYCFSRSANRGECAQMCRMEYDLIEDEHNRRGQSRENILLEKKHLLSLKDLCLIDSLQQLADAGAVSFKIEGRLKDVSYVKNVTAAYHKALDALVESRPEEYERASHGRVELTFTPDVRKSFNRGFTTYFLYGRTNKIHSFDTPKSVGEEDGLVRDTSVTSFRVTGTTVFHNGDGLCFIDSAGKLQGFRVNKVENGRLFPLDMPRELRPGLRLYRNFDKQFEDQLAGKSAERYIPVDIVMSESPDGFVLTMTDDLGGVTTKEFGCVKELARTHQGENIRRQLGKMGDTRYRLRDLVIEGDRNWFIPSSVLSRWKRELLECHGRLPMLPAVNIRPCQAPRPEGAEPVRLLDPPSDALMTCKHCIKFAMGWCGKRTNTLYLQLENGIRFRLEFDCKNCQMKLRKV